MSKPVLVWFLLSFVSPSTFAQKEEDVELATQSDKVYLLEVENGYVKSTHALPISLKLQSDMQMTKPYSYRAIFNEHPFEVTTVAMFNETSVLAVHAEKLADDSGILDYKYLKPELLQGIPIYSKTHCAQLTAEEIETAKDLKYFRANGFYFGPSIYLKQYFLNSEDGNSEYVITYGERVRTCEEGVTNREFKLAFEARLKNRIQLHSQL